jgi:hypothetical protein
MLAELFSVRLSIVGVTTDAEPDVVPAAPGPVIVPVVLSGDVVVVPVLLVVPVVPVLPVIPVLSVVPVVVVVEVVPVVVEVPDVPPRFSSFGVRAPAMSDDTVPTATLNPSIAVIVVLQFLCDI